MHDKSEEIKTDNHHCCCSIAKSCLTLCNPMVCSLPDSSVHGIFPARILEWNSPRKNTEVGCHSLLQGIFPAQGSNLCLLHCTQILYCLSPQGSPGKVPTSYLSYTWQYTYINTSLLVHNNPLPQPCLLPYSPCCISTPALQID